MFSPGWSISGRLRVSTSSCRGPGPPSAPQTWPLDEERARRIVLIPQPAGISTSAGSFSNPARAARRQADRCCGESPWRRATSDTTDPGANDSATIRPLISSLQRWRRTAPCGSEASTTSLIIDANRSVQDEPHVARQPARYNVGSDERLRSTPRSTKLSISAWTVSGLLSPSCRPRPELQHATHLTRWVHIYG